MSGQENKVIIAGSRSIDDLQAVQFAAEHCPFSIDEVIHGGADGVDSDADLWAKTEGLDVTVIEPDYDSFDPREAPLARNKQMAVIGNALIAVWDGESTGTKHMISLTDSMGIEKVLEKQYKDKAKVFYFR